MPGNDSNSYRAPVGHPRVQFTAETQTPQNTDEVTLPEITPAPDANVCGRTGCDEADGLATVSKVKPTDRTLCQSCREEFLANYW